MKNTDTISSTSIITGLEDKDFFTFKILETTASTNTDAKTLAEQGAREGSVIIAETQTLGRGRMDRSFSSPKGTGIYMSVILRPDIPTEKALMITTAAAVAVAEATNVLTEKNVGIKWVNDIYSNGKKVCGILTEAAINPHGTRLKYAVLGIGINVYTPQEGFPKEIKDIAGALYEQGEADKDFRNRLIAEVLNRFLAIYKAFPSNEYMQKYKELSILTGENVSVLSCGEVCGEGYVEDIDDNCGIVIRFKDGHRETLSSGEVSIKKKV